MPEEQYWITFPTLPLAIYRELIAHLRQVPGVDAEILPQASQEFNYMRSQAGGLRYSLVASTDTDAHQRVMQILGYYGDRFGPYHPLPQAPTTTSDSL